MGGTAALGRDRRPAGAAPARHLPPDIPTRKRRMQISRKLATLHLGHPMLGRGCAGRAGAVSAGGRCLTAAGN